jgi:CheY-like chemotaxis protein
MKALIVDPDASRAASVADALAAGGAQTAMAPSASFALTMLEWNRQDVIVSRAQVGDMDGRELCAILRADPSMKNIRFVLVANDVTPAQSAEIGIDLVIPDGLIGQAIATRVTHLMRRESEAGAATVSAPPPAALPRTVDVSPALDLAAAVTSAFGVPPATPSAAPPAEPVAPMTTATVAAAPAEPFESLAAIASAPPPTPIAPPPTPVAPPPIPVAPRAAAAAAPPAAPAPNVPAPTAIKGAAPPPPPLTELESVGLNGATRTFQGALGTLDLSTLAQAIASAGKTGRLLLVLTAGGGMMAFDSGRVVHAEIGNITGETAFQTLLSASQDEHGGKFCFIPSDPRDLTNVPKTITRSVSQLLEAAAKPTDEGR